MVDLPNLIFPMKVKMEIVLILIVLTIITTAALMRKPKVQPKKPLQLSAPKKKTHLKIVK